MDEDAGLTPCQQIQQLSLERGGGARVLEGLN